MQKQGNARLLIGAFSCAMLLLPGLASAGEPPLVAKVTNFGNTLVFDPVVEFENLILTVTGPCDFQFRSVIRPGDRGVFKLDETTIDGTYTYNLSREERVDSEVIDILRRARLENDLETPKKLCRQELLPAPPLVQAEGFLVRNAKIVFDPDAFEEDRRPTAASGLGKASFAGGAPGVPTKDFVINDDLIVDGSACIGFDCVNGESFSFDTIRLKENNLRIKFDDTSVAASFPATDWQLTANASANGGASKFSIDDISGGRTPFTVEANARSHSLYVDDGGRIGNRTSTPSTEIHTIDGDTPTLRLQQDGSSGFAPQTWDVAGNETNFFVRDVSNGSTLPFRIRPGAPTSSIFTDVDGDVGMGTASPDTSLHVLRTDGTAHLTVEDTSGTVSQRNMLTLENNGEIVIKTINNNLNNEWRIVNDNNGFVINLIGDPGNDIEMTIDTAGNVTIPGGSSYLGSDRNKKDGIVPVDTKDLLAKVNELPLAAWSWNDEQQTAIRHIGPMAQDFHALFGLGKNEITLTPTDMAGVALAAIQGLSDELETKTDEVERLSAHNEELESRLAALEAMVAAIAGADTAE